MSEKASFESAWSNHFPQEKPPAIVCFLNQDSVAPSGGQDGATADAVRKSLEEQRKRLDDLYWQVERQKFVVDYLTTLLARLPDAAVPRTDNGQARTIVRHDRLPPAPKPKPRPIVTKRTDSSADEEPGYTRIGEDTQDAAGTPLTREAAAPLAKRGSLPHLLRADGGPQTSGGVERSHSERPAVARKSGNSSAVGMSPAPWAAGPKGTDAGVRAPAALAVGDPQKVPLLSGGNRETEYEAPSGCAAVAKLTVQNSEAGASVDGQSEDAASRSPASRSASKSSDYVEIWINRSPAAEKAADKKDPAADARAGSPMVADRAAYDDSGGSASSFGSDRGGSVRRSASSRSAGGDLVLIQYDSDGATIVRKDGQPVSSSSSAAHTGAGDSDNEDEPTYVRLVYKALSTVKLAGLSASSGNVSVESSGSDLDDGVPERLDIVENEPAPSNKGNQQLLPSLDQPDNPPERSHSTEEEKLRMRQWVISSILESERYYVEDLDVILSYKKNLELATKTSQPLISMHDIDAIFGNIGKIHEVHQTFLTDLAPIVSKWGPMSEVGPQFKFLSAYTPLYEAYVSNWPNAIAALKRCCQENQRFQDLVSAIKCKSPPAERLPLEEILHKPINRIQRNTLVLHDLIQCTPPGHPDYVLLRRSLDVTHQFLSHMTASSIGSVSRLLVKNRLIVEHVDGKFRRLRHVFLFNDVIICTKPKFNRQKSQFEVKWHVPLCELVLSDTLDDRPVEWKQRSDKAEKEILQMKTRLRNLKAELRREMKEARDKVPLAPAAAIAEAATSNQKAERIRRKLEEEEAALALAEPRLRFSLESRAGQQYVFLMSSDYERNEWHESLASLLSKAPLLKMNSLEAQNVIDTCKDNIKLNSVSANILKEAMDQDIVSGQLIVTIHKLQGLPSSCDTYCAIEVDSFGHFHVKAKTHVQVTAEWDEEFELDLEAATTLRFICYKHTSTGDILLGKSALDLSKTWLRQGFHQKAISLNEVTLIVTIRYQTAEQTIQRIPSRVCTGVYGVKLSSTVHKEGTLVPTIVTACLKEVEKRGLDEVGIYRVSGMTSDVQRIKKAFDKSSKAGTMLLEESDINAVTGALKLYFRELPEALFTDKQYPCLLDGLNLSDPEAKEKCMVALISQLPDPNYHTTMAMLTHLIKVSSYEAQNKMPCHNLATVFGPTLLKPAQKPTGDSTAAVTFSSGASDALYQTSILFYFLTLVAKGTKFR